MNFKYPLMKNTFYNETTVKDSLCRFIQGADKLSMGTEVKKAEEAFAKTMNAKYCVMFNSGGNANLCLIQALKNLEILHTEFKVAFTALTWSTNITPLLALGFRNLTPLDVDTKFNSIIEKRADFYWLTNVLGSETEIPKGLVCIDSCETPAPLRKGVLAQTYSSFVGHHMSTIEGGYVVTNQEFLYNALRIVRANGWLRDIDGSAYCFADIGFNCRPTDITGFLAQKALNTLTEQNKYRHGAFDIICQMLRTDKVQIIRTPKFLAPFCIIIDCFNEFNRNEFAKFLSENSVENRPVIAGNITRTTLWRKYMKDSADLPVTDYMHRNCLYIGLHSDMTYGICREIAGIINGFML